MHWKRKRKYYLLRLFRLKASPHKVAMGIALGAAPNWFPTFGLGPALAVGIARMTKTNLIAAIFGGMIGVPLWPLLFLLNYKVGKFCLLLQGIPEDGIQPAAYLWSGGLQFFAGALVNVLFSSVIIYFIVFFLFQKFREPILSKIRY